MSSSALLKVEDLSVAYAGRGAVVERLAFEVQAGETLGLVGESGSGKSVTALAVVGLSGGRVQGRVTFDGQELTALKRRALRRLRGAEIAMIFQEPGSALDPVFTVGAQIAEVLRAHERLSRGAASRRALERMEEVGLPDPERIAKSYAHELSGGMQQRVLIAMATACRPRLLLADEPTTALDVTVQAQILQLLGRLQRENGMGMVLISHDLGVVRDEASRVAVMFAGQIVEEGPVDELFERPRHPYTLELLRARPTAAGWATRLGSARRATGSAATNALGPRGEEHVVQRDPTGDPRDLAGCRFRMRCPLAREACGRSEPPLATRSAEHRSACLFAEEVERP